MTKSCGELTDEQLQGYKYFQFMKVWMEAKLEGKSFDSYFKQYDYKKVALYGAGEIGKLILKEIQKTNIEIAYFIDKKAKGLINVEGIPVVRMEDINNCETVDAIIVTVLSDYITIYEELLKTNLKMGIIWVQEIVYEL